MFLHHVWLLSFLLPLQCRYQNILLFSNCSYSTENSRKRFQELTSFVLHMVLITTIRVIKIELERFSQKLFSEGTVFVHVVYIITGFLSVWGNGVHTKIVSYFGWYLLCPPDLFEKKLSFMCIVYVICCCIIYLLFKDLLWIVKPYKQTVFAQYYTVNSRYFTVCFLQRT